MFGRASVAVGAAPFRNLAHGHRRRLLGGRVRDRDDVRVSVRGALAFAGSAAIASSINGAAASLTAAPPVLTLCAGALLLALSMHANNFSHAITWHRWSVAALAGGC